jgi:hypothetical protein
MYYKLYVLFSLFLLLQLTLGKDDSLIVKRDDSESEWDQTTTTTTTTTASITATSTWSSPSNYNSEYSDESTQPINEDIYNSKDLFTTEPFVTDISNVTQVRLYCEVDAVFCKKVEASLIAAAKAFAQVVNLKNKIV